MLPSKFDSNVAKSALFLSVHSSWTNSRAKWALQHSIRSSVKYDYELKNETTHPRTYVQIGNPFLLLFSWHEPKMHILHIHFASECRGESMDLFSKSKRTIIPQ